MKISLGRCKQNVLLTTVVLSILPDFMLKSLAWIYPDT